MGFGQYSGRSYQGRGAERTGTKRERHTFDAAALGKPATLYARNGHTIHLGHYAIDRIERRPDGVHVIAGCHDVPLTEVEHVAAELGL
jgi:hypothetical protein